MASTVVFVDDAVRGDLPLVCARTGVPADRMLVIEKPVGGMGAAAWLLIFLGPLGWIVLVLMGVLGTGREMLTVRVPYSNEAIAMDRPWRRAKYVAGTIALAGVVLAITGILPVGASLVVAAVGVAVAFVCHCVLYLEGVDPKLDASRRWVTLSGVHPAFAAAVDEAAMRRGARP